jgi:tetratricopeptide (TPR) repeat protein
MAEVDDHIAAGDQRLARSDLDGAELCYRKAYAIDIRSANALHSIGFIQAERGNFQTAIRWAERAIERDPHFLLAYNLLGNALLALKRYEEALVALPKGPTNSKRATISLRNNMALCYAGLGRWAEAEQELRAVLEEEVTYATRFSAVGMISHEPLYADCHLLLAHVLAHRGDEQESMLHDRLARKIDPSVALTPVAKGILGWPTP